MTNSAPRFKGIIPPMVTPLLTQEKLDEPGLERLVDRLLQGGVHGIFTLGTTGEGPSLDADLKRRLIKRSVELAGGKIPVLVGISDASFTESLRLSDYAASCGASAVVLAPPFYFPLGQDEFLEYLEHLARKLPLPLMLYNMPSMTKIHLEPETIRQALEIPGIVGLKDSSGNMVYFHKIRQLLGKKIQEVSLLIGPEELLAEAVLAGADGGVTGGANIAPSLYVQLYEAACRQDMTSVLSLHGKVMKLGQLLYGVGRHGSSSIKGIKCALNCLGVCHDLVAEPFSPFSPSERAIIAQGVEQLRKEIDL